jgi:DHA2 family multidrug resistance protein
VGFGLIFVALSTTALSTISKIKMNEATGLYNVVRQIFGSIGIAITATQLTRGETMYGSILSNNLSVYNNRVSYWVDGMTGALIKKGFNPSEAHYKAIKLLDSEMGRQAGMLAYNRVFGLVAYLFVASIPLIFLLKHSKHPPDGNIMIE